MKCLSLDWSLSLVSKDRWTIFVASIVSKILQLYYELSHYELSALPIVAPTNGRHYELSSYELSATNRRNTNRLPTNCLFTVN